MAKRGRPIELVDGVPKTKHPLHTTWQSMIARCECRGSTAYKNYGGRGIRVCEVWRRSFAQFVADMGPKPSPKHSLDRINADADYFKENCRWATASVQARNKRGRAPVCGPEPAIVGRHLLRAWMRDSGVNPEQIGRLVTRPDWDGYTRREYARIGAEIVRWGRPNLCAALAIQRVTGIPLSAWLWPHELSVALDNELPDFAAASGQKVHAA